MWERGLPAIKGAADIRLIASSLIAGKLRCHRVCGHPLERGLPAKNDYAVPLLDRSAPFASKLAPTRTGPAKPNV